MLAGVVRGNRRMQVSQPPLALLMGGRPDAQVVMQEPRAAAQTPADGTVAFPAVHSRCGGVGPLIAPAGHAPVAFVPATVVPYVMPKLSVKLPHVTTDFCGTDVRQFT